MGHRKIIPQSHYVTDWLDKRAKLTPERIALIDYSDKSEITYAGWNERVNRTANFLKSLGVKKGDRVAVYASNRAEYLDLFWAADMEKRQLQRGFMLAIDAPGGNGVDAVPGDVTVGQNRALGETGCTAGVVNSPWIIQG